MSARRVAIAVATTTLVGSGTYLFVYLSRWEWNRALIAGLFFLAAEVALGFAVMLARLRARHPAVPARVLERIQEAAPASRNRFAWLETSSSQFSVFVPVLMGAGIVLSAVAWVVEQLARWTARPVLECHLANRLAVLSLPTEGLVPKLHPQPNELDVLLGPRPRGWS